MQKSYKNHRLVNILVLCFLFFLVGNVSHATFSIVAVDTITGAVGGAGASCIDNAQIITDLIEGIGGVHTQASYLAENQNNAHTLLASGLDPDSIIGWLTSNDAQGLPIYRQYGVVTLAGGGASAAFTGAGTTYWRGHITGPGYAIQGNILLSEQIVDTMEYAYLNTGGPLEDRLMAALEAANVPGADTRCMSCDKPAISAFIKVVHIGDGETLYLYEMVTNTACEQNPVDSLRILYDSWVALRYADAVQSTVEISHDYLGGYTGDSALITVTPLNHAGEFPVEGIDQIIISNLSYGGTIFEVFDNGDSTYSAWLVAADDYCIRDTITVSIWAGGEMTELEQRPAIYYFLCGDANGSCSHNILDVTRIIGYLYRGDPAPYPIEAGDPDGDGKINILDVTHIINYLYKGGSPPVCP